MHILHINVRLNEGGAAKVAFDIHRSLQETDGFSSSFAYGYSKGAKQNVHETEIGALSIAHKNSVIANWLFYKFLNIDLIPPRGKKKDELLSAISSADIIHIHAIHSFFLPLQWFLSILIAQNKKIVWTCHDAWLLTGRCAITDGCEQWKSSDNPCLKCPTKSNYPSVINDNARKTVTRKRHEIEKLIDSNKICFVTPSQHIMSDFTQIYPYAKIKLINNSVNQKLVAKDFVSAKKNRIDILVIAHDLSYEGKTDRTIVNALRQIENITIHTVGKNSPFHGENIINHGYVSDKETLKDIYKECDIMLFTSQVDNYPLVMCESLILSTPVIATPSLAANEVLSRVGGRSSINTDELLSIIKTKKWLETLYDKQSLDTISKRAENYFSIERMMKEYIDVYSSL